jgi:hypothetical protein
MRRVCLIFTSLTPHAFSQLSAGLVSPRLAPLSHLTRPDSDLAINRNDRRKPSAGRSRCKAVLALSPASNLLDMQDSML